MRLARPACALAGTVLAAAVLSATPADGASTQRARGPVRPVPTQVRDVRLLTGDTVRVTTRSDGSVVGAPTARTPYERFATPTASYVVPRRAAPLRSRLDLSLFDVQALQRFPAGRVPVSVAFRPGARVHAIPGLTLDRAGARAVRDERVVPAWYGTHTPGLTRHDLRGIASVRLAAPQPAAPHAPAVTGPTHLVQVHVATHTGRPSHHAEVLIQNVANTNRFWDVKETDSSGNVTATVPEGPYAVIVWTFSRVVTVPEVQVDADTSLDVDLGKATVRSKVTLPDHRLLSTIDSLARTPEKGFTFPLGFSGPTSFIRFAPVSGQVAHGSLHTGVSATLAHRATTRHTDDLAVTADVADGVPDDLTFAHHRRDLISLVQRFWADGPAARHPVSIDASTDDVDMFTFVPRMTSTPGRRLVLLEPGPHTYYQQTYLPQASTPFGNDLTQLITVDRFRRTGGTHVVDFGHGPLGPGEKERASAGFPWLVRRHDRLRGYLPLLEQADRSVFSYVDRRDGYWTLRQGDRVLAHGHHAIALNARLPHAAGRYTLDAVSRPRAADWTLSTRVEDAWSFRSGPARRTVRLPTPSYVPPITRSGYVAPGRTAYRLAFHDTTTRDHRIAAATFEVSTNDGRTWRAARLTRVGPNAFRVVYRTPPASATARYLSFRITGRDAHGDRVTETALRVHRLR